MVRMMYDLAAEGKTAYAISLILKDKQVPKPTAYVLRSDGSYGINKKCEYPYEWCATGTDGMIEKKQVKRSYTKDQLITAAYEERMRVTLEGLTVRKTLAIREQIGNI